MSLYLPAIKENAMVHRMGYSLLWLLVASANLAFAQQGMRIPESVSGRLDDDTLAVVRMDLSRPDANNISKFIARVPDATGTIRQRVNDWDQAAAKLVGLKAKEVYFVVQTSNLPLNGATVIVPSAGGETELQAIAEALKMVWPQNVEIVKNGVIVNDGQPRGNVARNVIRTEFSSAMAASSGASLQVAISLGTDARRVIREMVPQLPGQLGGGPGGPVADGWKWIAIGWSELPKADLQITVQAGDAGTAEILEKLVNNGLKAASESPQLTKLVANPQKLIALLAPKRNADKLQISLNESNGGAKQLLEEVAGPALEQMDKDARRLQSRNNLKQLMLAMHNYHDSNKAFPAQAVLSKENKKLLSWRVLLLPYVDEGKLFKEFHLDEPWDSEHNRKLVTRMPEVFASMNVTREQRDKGMTTYEGLVAENTLFGSSDAVAIKKIIDGTSNTVAIVDANSDRAVYWTQPSDLDVDWKQPLKGLTGQDAGRFLAGMCDGSVRAIADTIPAQTVRYLFQINDGQAVGEF